jgi:hypothetical protein
MRTTRSTVPERTAVGGAANAAARRDAAAVAAARRGAAAAHRACAAVAGVDAVDATAMVRISQTITLNKNHPIKCGGYITGRMWPAFHNR